MCSGHPGPKHAPVPPASLRLPSRRERSIRNERGGAGMGSLVRTWQGRESGRQNVPPDRADANRMAHVCGEEEPLGAWCGSEAERIPSSAGSQRLWPQKALCSCGLISHKPYGLRAGKLGSAAYKLDGQKQEQPPARWEKSALPLPPQCRQGERFVCFLQGFILFRGSHRKRPWRPLPTRDACIRPRRRVSWPRACFAA